MEKQKWLRITAAFLTLLASAVILVIMYMVMLEKQAVVEAYRREGDERYFSHFGVGEMLFEASVFFQLPMIVIALLCMVKRSKGCVMTLACASLNYMLFWLYICSLELLNHRCTPAQYAYTLIPAAIRTVAVVLSIRYFIINVKKQPQKRE